MAQTSKGAAVTIIVAIAITWVKIVVPHSEIVDGDCRGNKRKWSAGERRTDIRFYSQN